ncbi:MAG TPA: glucose-6-phosphate dehydrogenase assembly protein OpcA, partial [Chloroflexota bacterium]|nr:glucose-6-phosphate dehydrogenase assembly protein OpcA [Chloroflexota bacterium]
MDQSTDLGTPLSGRVSADAIEDALANSWQELHSDLNSHYPAVRASVLSLVVRIADRRRTNEILAAISHMSRQHPSRTIILLPGVESSGSSVRVWYDTRCYGSPEQDRFVCGEQVVLEAQGHANNYLPSLTDQLMLTDLPSFLWWVGNLPAVEDPLFDRLTALSDRLIVDSSDFATLARSLARLSYLARRRHQPCAPSDLNWARLTHWRALVAQFFDASWALPYLNQISTVSIEFNARNAASGRAQALLLISWLASQLGWRIDAPTTLRRGDRIEGGLRRRDGRRVLVSARGVDLGQLEGLVRLELVAGHAARFRVARELDGTFAQTEAEVVGASLVRRVVRFESAALSSLLSDELVLFRRDHVYEAALDAAVALTGGVFG